MTSIDAPVLDNHLHLDPAAGAGMDAVRDFERVGGTHLLIVNKPSWHLGPLPEDPADFDAVFETTVEIADRASEILPGRAWPVLGVHPTLISRLVDDGCSPAGAGERIRMGLDRASVFVDDGRALALKSGRPHYDVSDDVWAESNACLRHALERASDADCALQLHTEATDELTDVAGWARDVGHDPTRVVKHYAAGRLEGVTPSVMSEKDRLERAAERGDPFLMETDFVDDPERPGAVLGPKTVPRRVRWLAENGFDDAIHTAHVETPRQVYGIDTEATLS
ncbi:TatD-related deoxyribonuclease [Halovivax asiaticus JCM 14624]|uniref:TatD-related deoxyribonuclease n=1 Tax=Halovivax asiaticus JCM 14624 TaxID=1227490 RepID=M0BTB3_9EURY|nr:TatD family hydrolase [Halovivax asiaticus]ELZ14271.1 TatD-related deoxyribonuclease [Halovivax asiaticus JCM 14624]